MAPVWRTAAALPFLLLLAPPLWAGPLPDISTVEPDLVSPPMVEGPPAPGKRVRVTPPEYAGTEVHHSLYLPVDWEAGKTYPVIAEYAGNGPYANGFGDTCTGKVEDCNLGYGLSGGAGYLWICLPYISEDHQHNQLTWWGDVEATAAYAKTAIPRLCRDYGGDPDKVILAGFSRGSIACNYIGLHDDEISALWRGFLCHSHYDGVKTWDYPESGRASALKRLRRLGDRPQFISDAGLASTRAYLDEARPGGPFTFQEIPFRNHTDTWVLRDLPERRIAREWLRKVLREAP